MNPSTTDRIRRHLVGLKMPRALEALQTTLSRIEQGEVSALEAIEALLGQEYTTRESRRIKMALQTARLTTVKSLSGYDFSFQPGLDRHRVMALAELDFIERKQCVHLPGPSGHRQVPSGHRPGLRSGQGRQERLLRHPGRTGRFHAQGRTRGQAARAREVPSAATACSSSMRSAICLWARAAAICSSNWSTPATSAAP
jgi:hypothetical protein